LAAQYGDNLKWAMAGRNEEKLKSVREEIGAGDAPIIIADADDEASLRAMVARADVVITTTGPYQLYGEGLFKACAEAGTHYVDLCGEPGWMYDMIGKYQDTASKSGARLVFSCGFDSVPFDLGVQYVQNAAIEKWGEPASRVRCRVRAMNGEFSGGTAASFRATVKSLETRPELFNVLIDPFCLAGKAGPEQPADNKPYEDDVLGAWVAPFIMAAINTKNVHRSNALMGYAYGENFLYDEMMVAGVGDEGKAVAEFVAKASPLDGENVPQPGEGPSKEKREAGNYDILFIAEGPEGGHLRASVMGDMDPGYGSTSKMIAESALCLINDCISLAGGIYTPASSMSDKLVKRLISNAGLKFGLE
ncbi:MAG: saccharopine dehydrogenase NADP-binding domain-containing protein, partial [Paracoccaceae bacterium]|nr:saccharopine dehydrogenase NADP-binding domain-containing protein [Paracoccaceae bacterium]